MTAITKEILANAIIAVRAMDGGDTLHLCARLAQMPGSAPALSWVANESSMQSSAQQQQSQSAELLPRLVAAQQIAQLAGVSDSEDQKLKLALQYQLGLYAEMCIRGRCRSSGLRSACSRPATRLSRVTASKPALISSKPISEPSPLPLPQGDRVVFGSAQSAAAFVA